MDLNWVIELCVAYFTNTIDWLNAEWFKIKKPNSFVILLHPPRLIRHVHLWCPTTCISSPIFFATSDLPTSGRDGHHDGEKKISWHLMAEIIVSHPNVKWKRLFSLQNPSRRRRGNQKSSKMNVSTIRNTRITPVLPTRWARLRSSQTFLVLTSH